MHFGKALARFVIVFAQTPQLFALRRRQRRFHGSAVTD